MPAPRYTLITGEFYIRYDDLPRNGPEPDGDTINFLPDSDDLVQNLPRFSGRRPDRRHLDTYGVRFEGIDALETHFLNQHQNLQFAQAARDRMLQLMGFGEVQFWPDRPNKIKSAQNHPVPGYLLANGIESNGRVLGLVFPGRPDLGAVDGDRVFVDEAILETSVNTALVREGLAYGELYATMPLDLIRRMRQLVKTARQNGSGFWPQEDVTIDSRVQLQGLPDLPELIMFPKLYRRLVTYFRAGNVGLASFDTWIRADPVNRDDTALLPTGELGNLHDLYDVNPDGITLLLLPEDLTFQPDPTVR
ncbi:MAG: thermonuclease family protein [Pseudonocardiaceae bacterium]